MQMPGAAISLNSSNILYPHLALQAFLIFVGALVLWFVVIRPDRSSSGFVGRVASQLRQKLLSRGDERAYEPRSVAFIRISFGLLWIFDAILQAKPNMPSDMISQIFTPAVAGQPTLLASIIRAGLYIWRYNPVGSDVTSVLLQAGIGIGMLTARGRNVRRVVGYVGLIWSLAIFAFGEGFGMLFVKGASIIGGAPGAALFYSFASILLIVNFSEGDDEKARVIGRRVVGGYFFLGALLQLLPFEGFYTSSGISGIFTAMSTMPMPAGILHNMASVGTLVSASPTLWNVIFILVFLVIGAVIFFDVAPVAGGLAALGASVAMWYFGMGLGFLFPAATDPNSGVAIFVIVGALLVPTILANVSLPKLRVPSESRAFATLASLLALVVGVAPVIYSLPAAAASSSSYLALSDGGGLVALNTIAPNFQLSTSNGQSVSLSALKGKEVILTFLDPVCYDVCPVMASEITTAVASLGASAKNVVMVAIDVNPSFTTRASIGQFDAEHGLSNISNWYYLTGSLQALNQIWREYSVVPTVGPVGMISHPQVIYFINRRGVEVAMTGDTGSASQAVKKSYVSLISSTAKRVLSA
ncbi:MAG: SCO family protein [Actinomycetota bacterium]|nr:SCO family protein [Actinomycetota bacterium]